MMTDAPKRIFAWREEQGDVWTGEWCPADEAEFVPSGAWEMVPAKDLAAAMDDLEKARALIDAVPIPSIYGAGMVEYIRLAEDLYKWRGDARAALTPAKEG